VRFEVLTAVTMNNAVFWNEITQFVLYRRHIILLRVPSSAMLRRVALIRTDVSGERCATIIRVTRISEEIS
jgi:hypothetical protein